MNDRTRCSVAIHSALVIALAVLSTACTQISTSSPVPSVSGVAINPDIAEATFRYQFTHNESGQQARAHVYCIRFSGNLREGRNNGDPPKEFASRFSDVSPPVKPVSECQASAENGVTDRVTGQSGLIFSIASVACRDVSNCEVEGGYYEADESASGNTYYLEKSGANWVVVKDVMHWIS